MNKAEQIFKTYFADEESRAFFYFQHQVRSSIGLDGTERLVVLDADTLPQSFDAKPAQIQVPQSGMIKCAVTWMNNGSLHRDEGPAMIIETVNGDRHETWFKDGVAVE